MMVDCILRMRRLQLQGDLRQLEVIHQRYKQQEQLLQQLQKQQQRAQ
jgi:hypothetical protein